MSDPKSVDLPAQDTVCKTVSSGSTPATDSILFDAMGGKEKARAFLRKRAFNKGYVPPIDNISLGRHLIWRLIDDNKALRERLAEQGRELSQLKRKKK